MTELKDLPDPDPPLPEGYAWNGQPVCYHGRLLADRERVAPGRRVLLRPGVDWPYSQPEVCMVEHPFEWMFDGRFLICQGCGLDGT